MTVGRRPAPRAGHGTTSFTLAWAWFLLGRHPEVETRILRETEEVLEGRAPTAADVPRLKYTQRVFKEVLRLYHFPAHLAPVANGQPDIAEHLAYFLPQQLELMRIGFVVYRKTNERLGACFLVVRTRDIDDLALAIALDCDNRMHGNVHRSLVSIDRGHNRVNKKRHVIVDHFDEGVG